MSSASNMINNVKHTALLALMTLMFVVGFTIASPQKAEAGWELELGLGWDCMLLDSDWFDTTNNGVAGTISIGYRLFDLVGIYVEQDLGYIEPSVKKVEGVDIKLDKQFKGATLAEARLFLGFLPLLETSVKLGVGTMYMKSKDFVTQKEDWQTWFAFRAGLGLGVKLGSFRVGAEFDYTLGAADKNKLDRKDNTNFITVKGYLGYLF